MTLALWITFPRTSGAGYAAGMDDLVFADDSLPDDDVDVVVGMWRREWLREQEESPHPEG